MELVEIEISKKVKEIMELLEIRETQDNVETPTRIAKMLNSQLFKNRNNNHIGLLVNKMTAFEKPQNSEGQLISVKNIKFFSVCEHHWLPFFGECDIEYIPNSHILGLSKFPRVVKYFSKKPQVQERLTTEIGEFLKRLLDPVYLKVTIRDVTHTCVSARGAEAECKTTTIYERGER